MPVYTYHCDNCEHEFEKYQSFSENALTTCPNCKKKFLRKVYKPALVVFKGKGFYVTDNKSSKTTLSTNSNKENGQSETGDKDKPKSEKEPKSEKKAEKKTEKTEK